MICEHCLNSHISQDRYIQITNLLTGLSNGLGNGLLYGSALLGANYLLNKGKTISQTGKTLATFVGIGTFVMHTLMSKAKNDKEKKLTLNNEQKNIATSQEFKQDLKKQLKSNTNNQSIIINNTAPPTIIAGTVGATVSAVLFFTATLGLNFLLNKGETISKAGKTTAWIIGATVFISELIVNHTKSKLSEKTH